MCEHGDYVEYHSQRPNIHLQIVGLFGDHLWRHVLGRTTNHAVTLLARVELLGPIEVTQLQGFVLIEEHVLGLCDVCATKYLYVTMHDALEVQVLHSLTQLVEEGERLQFGQIFPLAQQLIQVALGTMLQHHENVLLVFEVLVQFEDVLEVELALQGQLTTYVVLRPQRANLFLAVL